MKFCRVGLAAFVVLFAIAVSAPGNAEEAGKAAPPAAPVTPAVPAAELEAKVQYCKSCHGAEGQGFRGATPIPRLAGQQPEYIEAQLSAFTEHRRDNRFMYGVAHELKPEMRGALATYFNGLNPKPTGSDTPALAAAGKKIFEEGLADKGVPPCASCHGQDAKGNGPFPRLAGQRPDYILRQLTNWSTLRGLDPAKPDNSEMMKPIIHGLSESQVKEVAAYVSTLE